jgi:hypothetical protein
MTILKTNISDLSLTVNAIRIDGKKLTKSIYDQFKNRHLFKSKYFENLRPADYQKDFAIIARHNYQIKENYGNFHFLYHIKDEIYVDNIHPNQNTILNRLSDIKKDITLSESKLEIAKNICTGANIDCKNWRTLTKGSDDYALELFIESIFEEGDNEVESLESALKFKNCISRDDFDRISANKSLASILEAQANNLANGALVDLPSVISNLREEFDSLQHRYEFVMDKIINAPHILIGV